MKKRETSGFARGPSFARQKYSRALLVCVHVPLLNIYYASPNYNKRPEIMQMFNREGAR